MSRNILPPESGVGALPTEDEVAVLTEAGFAPDRYLQGVPDWFNDYNGESLLVALRIGYALGREAVAD